MRDKNIGFIGAGNMASAMANRLTALVPAEQIHLCDLDGGRLAVLAERAGFAIHGADCLEMVGECDIIVFAVKPQDLEGVMRSVSGAVDGKLVISIAAGVLLGQIEAALPGARVVRVMPNLPCRVGAGMSAYCHSTGVSEADLADVERFLNSFGSAICCPESFMDVVTAVSGSGPAFFAYLANAFYEFANESGMSPGDSRKLVLETMRGTAMVLNEDDQPFDDFVAAVSSKGGTTAAGFDVLRQSGVTESLKATLSAAAARSAELSRG